MHQNIISMHYAYKETFGNAGEFCDADSSDEDEDVHYDMYNEYYHRR